MTAAPPFPAGPYTADLSFDPARVAKELLRPEFTGTLQGLYREAKSLEFLAHLLGSLEGAELAGPAELSRRVLAKVEEARDRLVSDLRNPPGLHDLAGFSLWVGDRKQCIFEYAGADPELMDAVLRWTNESGGCSERLSQNYRSRPELVELCSSLFAAAFASHGFEPEDVIVKPHRPSDDGLSSLPPVGLWWLEGREQDAIVRPCFRGSRGRGEGSLSGRAPRRIPGRGLPGDAREIRGGASRIRGA